jgi:hypothetical protein
MPLAAVARRETITPGWPLVRHSQAAMLSSLPMRFRLGELSARR